MSYKRMSWKNRLQCKWKKPHFGVYLEMGYCPDCLSGALFGGPTGGAGQNVVCDNCDEEFVSCSMAPVMAQRLGKASQERKTSVYGL